jgi:carboxyl-terminal processing protease
MKKVKRFAAILIAAAMAMMTLAVPAGAYDYNDYLKDAKDVTGVYTDWQLVKELGEVVTSAYRDYWTSTDPLKNLYDGVDKLADENNAFFEACMTEVLEIQRANSDQGMRIYRQGVKNSEILAEQIAFAERITGKTGIRDTVLETVINSNKDYFNGLTKAMMSFTDQYSRFITGKDYYADQGDDTVGMGVQLQNLGNSAIVVMVNPGSGAEAAGNVAGDAILEVNGKPFSSDMNTRGAENTKIKVTVLHADNTTEEITITRVKNNPGKVIMTRYDETMVISFKSYELMTDAADFEKYYDEAAADTSITKLVIDLRDNTGGDTEVLDAICSVLTEKGTLMYSIDTKTDTEKVYSEGKYKGAGVKFKGDIFVLTNGNSASSADITTAVIKNIGGTQVGDPTYGKGIGQSGFILHNGYMVWVTTLYVNMPNFGYYHGTPFTPDVDVSGYVQAFSKDEILPLTDTKSPLTPNSPKERIMAYQQRLQSFMANSKLEITGELDDRTLWLSDAVAYLAGLEPSKDGVISGEMVTITALNAQYMGMEEIIVKSDEDVVLEYCLDYGEEEKADKAA